MQSQPGAGFIPWVQGGGRARPQGAAASPLPDWFWIATIWAGGEQSRGAGWVDGQLSHPPHSAHGEPCQGAQCQSWKPFCALLHPPWVLRCAQGARQVPAVPGTSSSSAWVQGSSRFMLKVCQALSPCSPVLQDVGKGWLQQG